MTTEKNAARENTADREIVISRVFDATRELVWEAMATFDTLGRVTGVTNALGAFTYAYLNQTSRLSGVTYPSGTGLTTAYSYFGNTSTDGNPADGDQRLKTIQNFTSSGATNVSKFNYTYNAVGTIATWTTQADASTAIVNTLAYDGADQLARDDITGGTTAHNYYGYDPAGNRLTETTASTTTAGAFNNLNQLTALTSSTASQTVGGYTSTTPASSLTIDSVPATLTSTTNFTANVAVPAGTNIVSIVATPTTGPVTTKRYQIVTTGTTPTALTYDNNGNVHTDENGNTYTWDALNRLVSIAYHSGIYSGTHTEMAYDGLSRRVSIIEKSGTTYGSGTASSTKLYVWIGQEIAEERSSGTTVTKRFFPQGEQQLISGTLTPFFYTRDHLGSVRELMNSSGTLFTRYTYDPYGKTTPAYSSSNTSIPPIDATKQYAGYYQHQTSGLNLTLYRAYDANTGRWLNRDPLGEEGGLNLYGFVNDDPIDGSDPLGLASNVDLGGGYTARVDNFNVGGSSAYEIHVYGPNGIEVGVINQNGLIPKHGINSMPKLPPEVAKVLQKLNQNQFWKRGLKGPVNMGGAARGLSAICDLMFLYDSYKAACCQEKALEDLKKNHPEEYKKKMDETKDAP